MTKIFISFGAGSNNFRHAVLRITNQAAKLKIFDKIIGFNEDHLKNDSEFWSKHSNFIESNKKGYGYWIWKPYLIMKVLEKMEENDILLYCDSGCEISTEKKNDIDNFLKIVETDKIIMSHAYHNENTHTKMDLIHFLDMNSSRYLDSKQHQATAICIKKCNEIYHLVKAWYEICCMQNYHFIDDSPSNLENINEFEQHRHDQSILSLLTKKYNLFSNHFLDNNNAIDLARNRTGIPLKIIEIQKKNKEIITKREILKKLYIASRNKKRNFKIMF